MNKVVICLMGFRNKSEAIAAIMEGLDRKELPPLFTIAGYYEGMIKEVAEEIGAPFFYCDSLKQVMKESNYLIADLRWSNGNELKNLVMEWKKSGKHGRVLS